MVVEPEVQWEAKEWVRTSFPVVVEGKQNLATEPNLPPSFDDAAEEGAGEDHRPNLIWLGAGPEPEVAVVAAAVVG